MKDAGVNPARAICILHDYTMRDSKKGLTILRFL
jgi:hypothetical protein